MIINLFWIDFFYSEKYIFWLSCYLGYRYWSIDCSHFIFLQLKNYENVFFLNDKIWQIRLFVFKILFLIIDTKNEVNPRWHISLMITFLIPLTEFIYPACHGIDFRFSLTTRLTFSVIFICNSSQHNSCSLIVQYFNWLIKIFNLVFYSSYSLPYS